MLHRQDYGRCAEGGQAGERLTFTEQIEAKQERAAERAERFEDRAEKAEAESARRFKVSHDMMDAIPMGQPILIGHYSEKRDRAYRERAWSHLGKAVEAGERAKHYDSRAATARFTAAGEQFSNPAYLNRRIEEVEKEVRTILARIEGRMYLNSEEAHFTPTEADLERFKGRLQIEMERLEFYEAKLEEIGGIAFTRETLKGKQAVKIRGRWERIVRLNPKTVAIPNICYPLPEHQDKWALKYAYAEVTAAR